MATETKSMPHAFILFPLTCYFLLSPVPSKAVVRTNFRGELSAQANFLIISQKYIFLHMNFSQLQLKFNYLEMEITEKSLSKITVYHKMEERKDNKESKIINLSRQVFGSWAKFFHARR